MHDANGNDFAHAIFLLILVEGLLKMLNMVLKGGECLQVGDDVVIKVKNEGRTELAIDAPKEVLIKRLESEDVPVEAKAKSKRIIVVRGGN